MVPPGGGATLGTATLTRYDAEQPPTLLDLEPAGADCTAGGAVDAERKARNHDNPASASP